MLRKFFIALFFAAAYSLLAISSGYAASPFASSKPLFLSAVNLDHPSVPLYGLITLRPQFTASYQDPFDPDQISVYAVMESPKGSSIRVNGFLNQDFSRTILNGYQRLAAKSTPYWEVRFTPNAVGLWHGQLVVRDKTGTVTRFFTFRVTHSTDAGFIHRSVRNPYGFAYDNGKPFFAIGQDMAWGDGPGTFSYDQWLPALHQAGGNWIRFWMDMHCALEWPTDPRVTGNSVQSAGLLNYNLANAWQVDKVFQLAQANDINVMLCLGTYAEFTTGGFFNEGQWKNNPYNIANGGPCAAPADFWTNPIAQKDYKDRLRYIAARYGCYTNLQAWELWNETKAPEPWVAEMASALKGAGDASGEGFDPYRHLISTVYGTPEIDNLPQIDFTQTHSYGTGNIPDHAPLIRDDAYDSRVYKKPHLMGEFGIDWQKSDIKYDPNGLAINWHNGIWSSAMSGDAGSAMLWWWDNYVAPLHLDSQLTGLSRFAKTIPWNAGVWKPINFSPPITNRATTSYTDLILNGSLTWGTVSKTDYTITPSDISSTQSLPAFYYGQSKPEMRTTPNFHVDYPKAGKFYVHVDQVSNFATLQILLDNKPALNVLLSASPPTDPNALPDYQSTQLNPQYHIYVAKWDKLYSIDIPAGKHTVAIENSYGDWFHIDKYILTGYRSSRYATIMLVGLQHGKEAIFWAENVDHNWMTAYNHTSVPTIPRSTTVIRTLIPGRYKISWWNTIKGVVTSTETLQADKDGLKVPLPQLQTDVAGVIKPLGGA